jgi:hypothetical protein
LIVLISAIGSHGNSHKAASMGSTPSAGVQSSPPSHHAVAHVHYTPCDQNISVGPHTTCGFADNVFRAFAHEAAQGDEEASVTASSPATGRAYAVRCVSTHGVTVCGGGSSARVRFPLWVAKVYYKTGSSRNESNGSAPAADPEEPAPESSYEPEEESSEPDSECAKGTYESSSGNTVCRPEESSTVPASATAHCADGTYSFSEHRSGTCSYHGGVAEWLNE